MENKVMHKGVAYTLIVMVAVLAAYFVVMQAGVVSSVYAGQSKGKILPAVTEASALGTNIVATVYSADPLVGDNVCYDAHGSIGSGAGYWDLGNFSYCDPETKIPVCTNGSKKVITSATKLPGGTVKYHTTCVLPDQNTFTNIVATIYSLDPLVGENVCLTGREVAGYWDLGYYSYCDPVTKIPYCINQSKKVVLGSTILPNGDVKYHTTCVLAEQPAPTNIVATIYSADPPAGENVCFDAKDPVGYNAGYWDLGNYSYCDYLKVPRCQNGSKKIVTGMTLLPGDTIKYQTACVLTGQDEPTNIVATMYSNDPPVGDNKCYDADSTIGSDAGYWDVGDYSYCTSDTKIPVCHNGSKKIVTSMTILDDGPDTSTTSDDTVKYATACVLPRLLTSGAQEFYDGRNAVIFSHQDDDLLWMLPFWDVSKHIVLSAYPATDAHQSVVSKHSEDYQLKWRNPWGTVSDAEFASIYLNACEREDIVTLAAVKNKIRPYVSDSGVDRIITHNNWGEYGHVQHKIVNQAVRELAVEYGKDVWMLSVLASSTQLGAGYTDKGSFGLNYVEGWFDHGTFFNMKRIYQNTYLNNSDYDLWTWHDPEYEYPHDKQTFVKIVDNGVDLSINNAGIQYLVNTTPESGACQ